MFRIDIYLPNNDVMAISEALKKIDVGGLTVIKKRGRGRKPPPEMHAGKGSMIFTPQFSDKYVVELFIDENKKDDAIKIIQEHASRGKIIITPNIHMIDINSGKIDSDWCHIHDNWFQQYDFRSKNTSKLVVLFLIPISNPFAL